MKQQQQSQTQQPPSQQTTQSANPSGQGSGSQPAAFTIGHYSLGTLTQYNLSQYYIIGRSLGKGTFGKVKLATHLLTGEKVAVKILEKDKIKDKKDVERITREIKILKKVRHPNVIQLYEIIETEQELYLIMEYCANGELFDYIVSHQRLQEKQACKFYQELINGIEYIHKSGICHRDLKPENLLLDFDKTLKIVDFGLSNMYEDGETLKTACGSPCYAAPEMIAGKRYLGLRTDIWSSGVILFAMVCGFLPFEDPKTSNLYKKILSADYQIPKFVSTECADIMQKILNTNPDSRYTLDEIRAHPWYRQIRDRKNSGLFPGVEKMPINDQIYKQMMGDHKFDPEYSIKCIEANRHNQITATFHLLYKKALRQNKNISDTPLGVTGSIDRANQPKNTRAQKQEMAEVQSSQNNRRGQSTVAGGSNAVKQDLNQTLPAQMYPGQQLQNVLNIGDDMNTLDPNSNNNEFISAQKKYKLQMQAEINKLKNRYQVTNGQGSQGVQGNSNRKSLDSQSLQLQLNTEQQKMTLQSNNGESSPSPDQIGFVQNLQQQLSQASKNGGTLNPQGGTSSGTYSNGTNSKFYQTGTNFHQNNKLPSTSTNDSIAKQTPSIPAQSIVPINGNGGNSGHQRFKTQQQIAQIINTAGGNLYLGQIPQSFDQTRIKLQGGGKQIVNNNSNTIQGGILVPNQQHPLAATKIGWNKQNGKHPQQFFIQGANTMNATSYVGSTQPSSSQYNGIAPSKISHHQKANSMTIDESMLNNSALIGGKNQQFNATLTNFSTMQQQLQQTPGQEKFSSVTYKRGKTSSIDQSGNNQLIGNGGRISATQQLNMSAIIPNNKNRSSFTQQNDYAYPIGSQSPAIAAQYLQQQSVKQNKNKINDLSIQMANLEYSTIKVPRTSNPTGQNKIGQNGKNGSLNATMEFPSRQGTAASQAKQKSTMRYQAQGNEKNINNSGGLVNKSHVQNESPNTFLNDSAAIASANLNISELYKQYVKKQGGNNSMMNNTQISINQVRHTPGQHKSQPRAISVIEGSSNMKGHIGGGLGPGQSQQQQIVPNFSNRHGSQSQNRKVTSSSLNGKY